MRILLLSVKDLVKCFDKWISLTNVEKNYDSVRDLVLSHKVLDTVNPKLKAFLVERDCNDIKALEENATHFFNAHPNESLCKESDFPFSANYTGQTYSQGQGRSRSQYRNGPSGPKTRFRSNSRQERYNQNRFYTPRVDDKRHEFSKLPKAGKGTEGVGQETQKREYHSEEFFCYNCGGRGHIRRFCPSFLANKCTVVENWRDNRPFSVTKTDPYLAVNDNSFFKLPDSLSIGSCNNAKVMSDQHIYEGLLETNVSMKTVRV